VKEAQTQAGYLIWRLSNTWRAATDRALAAHGLTHAQYSALASLYGLSQGGRRPSQRELADFTGLDAVYISKLVRALERAGFVTRSTSASDPRAVELALTAHGETTVQSAIVEVRALADRLTEPLGGNRGAATQELTAMVRKLLDHAATMPED
jgi:DNA-binding MarR family transcriptional regulator